MVRVCVIGPGALTRECLTQVIESKGITVSASVAGISDIDWATDGAIDLVLLDLASPAESLDGVEQILRAAPGVRVIVLAETFDLEVLVDCLRRGAHGYLVKDMASDSLVASIHLAATGARLLPSSLADLLHREPPFWQEPAIKESSLDRVELSQREFDVLSCLMAGYPNKVIARQLAISEATIKVHVKAILRKLKVMNRTQAAIWAAARGLPANLNGGFGRVN